MVHGWCGGTRDTCGTASRWCSARRHGGHIGTECSGLRAVILSDLELLQRIPEAEVARRAALKRMLGEHVEALLVAQEKSREFRRKTRYFTEHWRDIVLFVTTLLFVRGYLLCRPPSSGLASAANCDDCDVRGNGYLCGAWLLEERSAQCP
jgi:hypothetical protein